MTDQDTADGLLPCPFCGGEALMTTATNKHSTAFVATCSGEVDSGCTGLAMNGFHEDEGGAIAAWNTRACLDREQGAWRPISEAPRDGQRVIARYEGVYEDRVVTFWMGNGGSHHYGLPYELDGKGSQPATHWMQLPAPPAQGPDDVPNDAVRDTNPPPRWGRAPAMSDREKNRI